MEVPGEALLAPRRSRFLGLVCVNHDLHAVANGGAHRLDLGNVLLERGVVEAKFYGPIPLVEQAQGVVGSSLGSADLDQAGVGANAIGVRAPEFVQREIGGLTY